MPVIDLYQETISEAIAAHFSGFRHVAVGGLIPVVEGVGRELARQRGLKADGAIKAVFGDLLEEAKGDVKNRKIGATQEILDMLDAFLHFLREYFFKDSQLYSLLDKTNRHGILHGAYKDADYGRPINFYKTISAIDILTFVSMLKTKPDTRIKRACGALSPVTTDHLEMSKWEVAIEPVLGMHSQTHFPIHRRRGREQTQCSRDMGDWQAPAR
jgi:hypothetical protein